MSNRTIHRIGLRPILGSRFQPTGFPDLGPALFERSGANSTTTDALLVESVQSMANCAERTTWDDAEAEQVSSLAGLPHVRVVTSDGEFLTSSRLEAHRLASAYVMDATVDGGTGEAWLETLFGLAKGRPQNHRRIAAAICRLDPLSLVHGVFFARGRWPWQPKIARALTCFIEADGVRQAVSGGVKKDSVDQSGSNTDTGYGMVPHQRVEFTATSITAYVAVDLDQISSYGLGAPGEELLNAIVDFQLATIFEGGLRLRTSCDLEVVDPPSSGLPSVAVAEERVGNAIASAGGLLGPITEVVWSERSVKAKK
ncbi:type I-U CRISPR-associated RAMP protein Csb1/Cas7u [uncultured Friedmanniella sp.]|uniref:type I-G CRISPR-associated RAMP protein Csb1/Cas7g n=1 Tax=uncultured Friedmanniella sp. TaxID=335381 RepID=UPI0035CB9C8D